MTGRPWSYRQSLQEGSGGDALTEPGPIWILLDQGWRIAEVAHRLGHANAATTAAIYGHKLRDRRRDLSFLDELGSQDGQLFGHTEHPQAAGDDEPSNAVDSAG